MSRVRYLLGIAITTLERVRPREEGPRRRHRRWVWLTAAAIALVAVVGVAAILFFAGQPTLPVTPDPPPASNVATGQTFAQTKTLISDPYILSTSKLDYMYSSGAGGPGQSHVPERTYRVMGKFHALRDAMPTLPTWAEPNSGLWAPDVRKVGKTYVMWFSGLDAGYVLPNGNKPRCIGFATSTTPTGPFTSNATAPTICQTSEYGDIDPRTLVTPNGQEWLYWKDDGNAVTTDMATTYLYAQRLAPDGQTLIGSTSVLLANDLPWEGQLIEAPDMVHVGNRYVLFFSSVGHGIGLAFCKSAGGPCTSPFSGPWLGSNIQGAEPGEESVYSQNGVTWMLYTPHGLYYPLALPRLAAARIAFTSTGMPYIANRQNMIPGVTAGRGGQVGLR
jgi:Glycosyl hydrolases family 43